MNNIPTDKILEAMLQGKPTRAMISDRASQLLRQLSSEDLQRILAGELTDKAIDQAFRALPGNRQFSGYREPFLSLPAWLLDEIWKGDAGQITRFSLTSHNTVTVSFMDTAGINWGAIIHDSGRWAFTMGGIDPHRFETSDEAEAFFVKLTTQEVKTSAD